MTNPKEIICKNDDLALIPRKEYEALSQTRVAQEPLRAYLFRKFSEVTPTKAELSALKRGREAMKRGDYMTLEQFHHELDTPRRQWLRIIFANLKTLK